MVRVHLAAASTLSEANRKILLASARFGFLFVGFLKICSAAQQSFTGNRRRLTFVNGLFKDTAKTEVQPLIPKSDLFCNLLCSLLFTH